MTIVELLLLGVVALFVLGVAHFSPVASGMGRMARIFVGLAVALMLGGVLIVALRALGVFRAG